MKPSIPKGTRDFSPVELHKRQYIFGIIRDVYERFGFHPIETPVMENLSTLTGKYGEEGDKLLFKVLNNGDFLSKADPEALAEKDSQALAPSIARRGLRYDLTVPFARYVVMHQNDLTFPFKRYQIQPVWRADRPQKGRYQEFYQCDADAIGSDSLMYEAEYIQIIDEVFSTLGLKVEVKINSRKILAGIAEVSGVSDRMMEMTMAVDKLWKIGWEGVRRELLARDFTTDQIDHIQRYFSVEDVQSLRTIFADSEIGTTGLDEVDEIHGYLEGYELSQELVVDVTLARGLNYYTGCIFEVVSKEVKMGSILGGGRYDDLTGVFGMAGMSGVGISFGVERIFDILEELKRFPDDLDQTLDLLMLALDPESHKVAFKLLTEFRDSGLRTDLYPEPAKMKKQMKYANQTGVSHTLIIGSEEVEKGIYTLKNMKTGDQQKLSAAQIVETLQS